MDTGRQILRYSIPGSLFLLGVLSIQGACWLAWHQSVGEAVKEIPAGVIVAVLAASVPIGFLLYQLYYFRYGPLRLGGIVATSDRGAEVLDRLSCAQRVRISKRFAITTDHRPATGRLHDTLKQQENSGLRLLGAIVARAPAFKHWQTVYEWRDDQCLEGGRECDCLPKTDANEPRTAYAGRWYNNWDAVMATLDYGMADTASAEIKREYTTLSDIYHALGASRIALWSAGITAAAYNILLHYRSATLYPLRTLVLVLIIGVSVLSLTLVVDQARRQTQKYLLRRLGLTLRARLDDEEKEASASEGLKRAWEVNRM